MPIYHLTLPAETLLTALKTIVKSAPSFTKQRIQLSAVPLLKKTMSSAYLLLADLHGSTSRTSAPICHICAHLKQSTQPSKKLTNIRDVKRYLNLASVSKDGLLVVPRSQPLTPSTELIVVPHSILDGLLTALHIKLDHPSKHQLLMVVQRHFLALDMSTAITRMSDSCHTCASLKMFPGALASQSSDDPPEVVGLSFAADVIRCCGQRILQLRETTTSYTVLCIVPDKKSDNLCDTLT